MGKKVKRVQVHLDSGSVTKLPSEEISAILRAADELVGQGGRALLVKILKGSKEKRVLELELNQCPSYGYYRALRVEEVGQKVDWMIRNDYLRIQYDYRLPMIVFSPKGWEIEKRNYAAEVYEDFCKAAKEQDENIIEQLKEHTNRQVVLIVLDLLREREDASLIPILEKWKAVEVKKIRDGIGDVISAIEER